MVSYRTTWAEKRKAFGVPDYLDRDEKSMFGFEPGYPGSDENDLYLI